MDSKTYMEKALRTNTPDYNGVSSRLLGMHEKEIIWNGDISDTRKKSIDLLHAIMGMQTESAEMTDAIKKHIFYGKELDEVNLFEEIGDQFWYCAIALNALGKTFEEAMQANIDKLSARYPDKFTEEAATNRDLDKEREILENATQK